MRDEKPINFLVLIDFPITILGVRPLMIFLIFNKKKIRDKNANINHVWTKPNEPELNKKSNIILSIC
jgi:hypothetical protein